MVIKNLYKYSDECYTIYSFVKPSTSFQAVFRLIPDVGKVLYNGAIYRSCIDVESESIDNWTEVGQEELPNTIDGGGDDDDYENNDSSGSSSGS